MAEEEEVDITIRALADLSGAQQVADALRRIQQAAKDAEGALDDAAEGANAAMRASMGSGEATLKNFQQTFDAIKRQLGVAPTLRPEDFGIEGGAAAGRPSAAMEALMRAQQRQTAGGVDPIEARLQAARREQTEWYAKLNFEAEKQFLAEQRAAAAAEEAGPSRAFATLQAARERQLAGGADPVELRLEQARRQQAELYARLNAEAEKEFLAEQKAAAAQTARSQRLEAGLLRRIEAQGVTEPAAADDTAVQARLYQARAQQQRQFDQLIRERAAAFRRADVAPPVGDAPVRAVNALRSAMDGAVDTTQSLGAAFNLTGQNVIRLAGSLLNIPIGLSLYAAAGALAHKVIEAFVTSQIELERTTRANTIALGQQATEFQTWATTISQQAGIARQSLLEVGTAAAQVSRQIGLGPGAVENLTAIAVLLARIRGQNVAETMNQLSAAMQGNAGAAQALGLQLDAAFVAYTQLGGATAETFGMLDQSTQEYLRYVSVLQQVERQSRVAGDASTELAAAQEAWGAQVERVTSEFGPMILGFFAGLIKGAADVLRVMNDIRAFNEALFATIGESAVQASTAIINALGGLVQGIGQKIDEILTGLLGAAREAVATIGSIILQAATLIRTVTGVDVLEGVSQAINAAGELSEAGIERVRQALAGLQNAGANYLKDAADAFATEFEGLGRTTRGIADAIAQKFEEIRNRAAGAGSAAMDRRSEELQQMLAAASGPLSQLEAARNQEIAAAKALSDLRRESVELGAQEAAIRLTMLPAQQQMVRLQNEINQAQLLATQRALPASRALQDLQNEIEQRRLIAIDPRRAISERQRAQEEGAALSLGLPAAQLASLQAGISALPAQRAAQDVQAAAQLQALQQAAALFGVEFRQQELSLLSTIADAAKQAATRVVQLSIQGVNVIFQMAGAITPDDEKKIVELVGTEIAAVIHAAVQQASTRPAPAALIGATP